MEDTKSKSGKALPLQKLSNYYSSPIKLEKDDRVSGAYAWAALVFAVVAYDIFAIKTQKTETLTRYFWRSTEEKKKSILPIASWVIVTAHLLAEKNIRRKKFGEQKH
jgi:hypothetical protein